MPRPRRRRRASTIAPPASTDGQKDKVKAEEVYTSLLEVDPTDEIAKAALEGVKALGKFEDVVEMLLARSQDAGSGEDRARSMAEIGHLYSPS